MGSSKNRIHKINVLDTKDTTSVKSGISYTKITSFSNNFLIHVQIYYSTERRNMEEIIKSEYEDVYRVTDGCNSSCEEI